MPGSAGSAPSRLLPDRRTGSWLSIPQGNRAVARRLLSSLRSAWRDPLPLMRPVRAGTRAGEEALPPPHCTYQKSWKRSLCKKPMESGNLVLFQPLQLFHHPHPWSRLIALPHHSRQNHQSGRIRETREGPNATPIDDAHPEKRLEPPVHVRQLEFERRGDIHRAWRWSVRQGVRCLWGTLRFNQVVASIT